MKYAYKALDPSGKRVEGEIEAAGRPEVDAFFLQQGLTPVGVREVRGEAFFEALSALVFRFREKLYESELIAFTRQFAAAYGAGLSIPRALLLIGSQLSHPLLKKALVTIADRIQSGRGLSASFREFPRLFDTTYVAILNSGEVSGNLDTVMNFSAGLLERKMIHRERIKSTLLYPKLVVLAIIFTVIVMLVFVIPQFQRLYDRFGAALPLPTRVLVAASDVVVKYWWMGPAVAAGGYILVQYLKRNERFMLWFDERMLKLPIFGTLILKVELTQFCTTFALLLRSGIKVTDATEIAIRGMRNAFMRHQMGHVVPFVEAGGTLSGALDRVKLAPPLLASMIAVGEESGHLEALLDKVAALYDSDVEMILKRMPTLLEPIILSFLFVLVLGLAVAVYMPMWKLSSLVRGTG